jgi:hypothetical protein
MPIVKWSNFSASNIVMQSARGFDSAATACAVVEDNNSNNNNNLLLGTKTALKSGKAAN